MDLEDSFLFVILAIISLEIAINSQFRNLLINRLDPSLFPICLLLRQEFDQVEKFSLSNLTNNNRMMLEVGSIEVELDDLVKTGVLKVRKDHSCEQVLVHDENSDVSQFILDLLPVILFGVGFFDSWVESFEFDGGPLGREVLEVGVDFGF